MPFDLRDKPTDAEIGALIDLVTGSRPHREIDMTSRRRELIAEALAFYRQKRPLIPSLDDLGPFRVNLRHIRATQLTGFVMSIIHSCMDGGDRLMAGAAAEKLMDAFFAAGVQVVTDADRVTAGLPPRSSDGWTPQELAALEARRLEAMSQPVSAILPVNLG